MFCLRNCFVGLPFTILANYRWLILGCLDEYIPMALEYFAFKTLEIGNDEANIFLKIAFIEFQLD